ncbi:SDR family NAD(P)-dependent oxidoreductase [Actinacidiphila paucisporea]|uniref:3-oxoacyl-[acyl-carrier protein] reductase n=1 Tax=Actinacidiphila paucisporea TaxID=310782 RepID=A0A1M6YZR4_9ACTN|nr:SDR family NAD(P)-dependent oxidoreductase [Actinacidiphila paucisporea]SHL23605.1 3-oxoacyl-[acyl-carrier protein] reductase [Actinacidiphila paucisporea]
MPRSLKGHTALVTGATGGLGAAIARRLAAEGAAVVLAHLDCWDAAGALAEEITADGGTARPVEADLRDLDAVRDLCQQAHSRLGPVDILVSNAGAYPRTSWAGTTPNVWDDMLATNLTSHYLLAHELTAGMAAFGWGRIITIGSVLATAGRHEPRRSSATQRWARRTCWLRLGKPKSVYPTTSDPSSATSSPPSSAYLR